MRNTTMLVIGGTGKTGRHVTTILREQGVPVKAASRSGDVRFDWEDESTWEAALEGVGGVYLMAPETDDAIDRTAAFARMAKAKGAERLVLLSLRATHGGGGLFAGHEDAVRASGLDWTILRPAWFNQNFNEGMFYEPLVQGELQLPTGDGREPFVDTRDVAAVAVAALTQDGHAGRLYELTGPRALTFARAVAAISDATGRDLRFTPVSSEAFTTAMTEHVGLPREIADFLVDLFGDIRNGDSDSISGDVHKVLGRPPRDFSDFVKEAAASGAWKGAS